MLSIFRFSSAQAVFSIPSSRIYYNHDIFLRAECGPLLIMSRFICIRNGIIILYRYAFDYSAASRGGMA